MHENGGQHASKVHEKSIAEVAGVVFQAGGTKTQTLEALAAEGVMLTRETGTDAKTGKTYEYGKLSREGEKPISLRQLGLSENGKPLFSLPSLEKGWRKAEISEARQQLAKDAAGIFDRSGSWREAETGLAAAGITYNRVKTTITDKSGEEKEIIVGRINRDGIETTTGTAGKEYAPSALDARYMPYQEAKSLYAEARTQANPVAFLASQGLTVSDIDRIGRVGEKAEKALQRKEKPAAAPAPQAQAQPIGKSVIPTSLQEILDMLEESAQQTAALAQANARAGQAVVLARRAEAKAAKAEAALAELKASIRREEKQPKPAPVEPKEKDMATGTGGAALTPETKKDTTPEPEVKTEGTTPENNAAPVDDGRAAETEQSSDEEQVTPEPQIDLSLCAQIEQDFPDELPQDDDPYGDQDRM